MSAFADTCSSVLYRVFVGGEILEAGSGCSEPGHPPHRRQPPGLPGPLGPRLQAQAGWGKRGHRGVVRGLLQEGRGQGRCQLFGRGGGLRGGRGTRPFPACRGASSSHPGRVHHPHAHAGEGHKDTCLSTTTDGGRPPPKATHSSRSVLEQQRSLSTLSGPGSEGRGPSSATNRPAWSLPGPPAPPSRQLRFTSAEAS